MNIHNKLEIVFPDKNESYVFFNTMLLPLLNKIKDFLPWNNRIAFGNGSSASSAQMTTLEEFSFSKPSTIFSFNYDPSAGDCFVKKQIVFGESDQESFSFSEVGISFDEESGLNPNPLCASRFLVQNSSGEAVTLSRAPGEKMLVSVSVYLVKNAESNSSFVSGSNLLIKTLLGVDSGEETISFSLAVGRNLSANSETVDRSELTGHGTAASINYSITDGKLSLSIFGALGKGYFAEVVVLFCGEPVMRFNAIEAVEETTITETNSAVNSSQMVRLTKPNVTEISFILDTTDSTYYTEYTLVKYGTSFGSGWANPFDFPYSASTPRYVSADKHKIAFLYSGRFDIYDVTDGLVTRLDSSAVTLPSGYHSMAVSDDFMLVHYRLDGHSYFNCYHLENGVYVQKTINIAGHFDTANCGPIFSRFDFSVSKQNWIRIIVTEDDGNESLRALTCVADSNFDVVWGFSKVQNVLPPLLIGASPNKITADCYNIALVKNAADTYYAILYSGSSASTQTPNAQRSIISVLPTSGHPTFRGLAIQNGNGDVVIFEYAPVSCTPHLLGTDTKIYVSYDGNYLVRQSALGLSFWLITESIELVPFENDLPLNINPNEIQDVIITGGTVFVFLDNSFTPIVAFSIYEDKVFAYCNGTKNDNVSYTYKYKQPIGSDTADSNFSCLIEI